MRVIKFRLWDKKHESFVHEPYHAISLLGSVQIEGHTSVEPKRYIIQQFTGLTDKNGKEIYEGDIVKCLDGYNATVSYDEWKAEFIPFGSDESAEWGHGVEIIGNVYENPELLTKEEV
jgi:uncharacterized phage protein (TIGR01671 family)